MSTHAQQNAVLVDDAGLILEHGSIEYVQDAASRWTRPTYSFTLEALATAHARLRKQREADAAAIQDATEWGERLAAHNASLEAMLATRTLALEKMLLAAGEVESYELIKTAAAEAGASINFDEPGPDRVIWVDGPVIVPFRVEMIMRCPVCSTQHIDRGEWATRPHHRHLCEGCGSTSHERR